MKHPYDQYFNNESATYMVKGKYHNYPVTTILKKDGVHIFATFTSGSLTLPSKDKDCNDGIYLGYVWRFCVMKEEDGVTYGLEVFYTNGDINPFFHTLKKHRTALTTVEERLVSTKKKYRRNEIVPNHFEYTEETFNLVSEYRAAVEESIKCVHSDKIMKKPKEKKIFPTMVPPGTVVRSVEMFLKGHRMQHTVESIMANGIESYVVTFKEPATRTPTDNYFNQRKGMCFNLSYIDKIISRPHGVKAVIEGDEINEDDYNKKCKTKYNISSFYFRQKLGRLAKDDQILDSEKLVKAIKGMPFVKYMEDPNGWGGAFYGNKKKVMKWVKQNFSRFLVTKKKALATEDELNRLLYSDDGDIDYYDHAF